MSGPTGKFKNIPIKAVGSPQPADVEESLYEVRKAIHPRAVTGWFANWRIIMVLFTQLLFYGAAWVSWNDRQAVLFDLVERKFYILGFVFWPQDFILLTALLVISALALFLFTAVAGRLFCGYACPQTVYTEIFMWIERKVEGDRPKRMKLDEAPMDARKFRIKATKHLLWVALSLWTGFTFVGYFTPIKQLAAETVSLGLGPWEAFWILFYGFATYGNAGWMREQVCKYMCPYARFQSAMFDPDTLIISYDRERGEPRGSRNKNKDYKAAGLGSCVDCGICVQVCPTGIDIRNGLQYECIGCAACIDGCNQVMDKMGYPRGLIRYTTEKALQHAYSEHAIWKHALRPRTLFYSVVLLGIVSALGYHLLTRNPLRVDVIRDRNVLVREAEDGRLENVYRLNVMNSDETPHLYTVTATGLPGLAVVGLQQPVGLAAVSNKTITVRLRVDPKDAPAGSHKIHFQVQAQDDPKMRREEKSSFLAR